MAKSYSIETVFKLIDQVSAPTSKISKALDKLGIKSKTVSNALKRDFDKAAARIDKLGASIKKWAGRAVLGGIAAIGVGIGVAAKQFIEFDSQLQKAGSIFSDLNPLADDFKTRLDAIGKAARNVAAATEFNAEQTASALATMAQAGIKSEQAIALLPRVADMATAASVDLDQAVGMAAGALNVFGKMTDDPLKLAENLQYVSDVMVRGANLADMSLSDMSASVSVGGARFKEANQRVEDYIAAIDILASVNKKGAEAGNAISAMMTRLAAKPGDVSKALNELGIRTQDAQGNMLNFVDIMGQLNVALNGMGTAKQDEYLYRIFGQNRINYARPLIDAGVEGFRTYSRELDKAAGSTAQAAEVMRQSIKNKLAVLGSAATEMGFKFVEAFKDKAVVAIESATKAIENFDVAPLVEMAGAAADGIMKFAGMLAGAVKIAWQFRGVIVAIAAPIAAYNLALMGIIVVMGIYHKWQKIITAANFFFTLATKGQTAALAGLTAGTLAHTIAEKGLYVITGIATAVKYAFTLATKGQTAALAGLSIGALANSIALTGVAIATKIATAAQWAFNAAAAANPIVLIIMGAIIAVAALIAIIVLLAKNWDKVTAVAKQHSNKIMAVLAILYGPIGFIISMIKEIASNWAKIKEALAAAGLYDKIKEIGEGIKSFFGSIGEKIVGIWNAAKEKIASIFNGIGEAIMAKIGPVVNKIISIWDAVKSKIGEVFKGISDAVYNFVKPAFDFFAEKWQQIVSFFTDNAIVNAIKVIAGTLISGLLAPIQGILEALSYIPGLGHLAGKGAEKIEEFRNFLKGIDGATVTADVNVPETVEAEITSPVSGMEPLEAPGFGIPGIGSVPGTGGKSKLHGVVDISGGAIPAIGSEGSYTAASAIDSASPPGTATSALTSYIISIAATLQKIDASVSLIARILPQAARAELPAITAPVTATRTSPALPRINMGGGDGADYSNPRDISPVTQAERMAYSFEERQEKIVIEVAAEKGTAARIVRAPRDVDIQLVASGGNA